MYLLCKANSIVLQINRTSHLGLSQKQKYYASTRTWDIAKTSVQRYLLLQFRYGPLSGIWQSPRALGFFLILGNPYLVKWAIKITYEA